MERNPFVTWIESSWLLTRPIWRCQRDEAMVEDVLNHPFLGVRRRTLGA